MICFGPIPSRRLGKSLGINNIFSPKTCSYNCIYCQVGKTRLQSIKRDSFYKPVLIYDKVVQHLERFNKDDYPDYLTFVANGEPTLDKNLGYSIKLLNGFEGTDTGYTGNIYEDILNITSVHPLREDTLNELLAKDKADYKIVDELIRQRLIRQTTYKGKRFFIREYHINF